MTSSVCIYHLFSSFTVLAGVEPVAIAVEASVAMSGRRSRSSLELRD